MLDLVAKDVMTEAIIAVPLDWPIDKLAEHLVENSISGAPVIDDNEKLVGVVSLMDIVRSQTLVGEPAANDEPHEYYLVPESPYTRQDIAALRIAMESPLTVRDIMTPMIFSFDEDTDVQEIADAMIRGRIHRVLITRDDQVVGIITALDMLRIIRDL